MTEVICETGDVNPFAAHIHTVLVIALLVLLVLWLPRHERDSNSQR